MTVSFSYPAHSRTKKRCKSCQEIKPGAEFYKMERMADGLKADCKVCCRKRTAENKRRRREHEQRR